MIKLIHLSDLHFGTEIPGRTSILIEDIHQMAPDVIVVSGDLTQRATSTQFAAAQVFLHALNQFPIVCVPGNHDVALYNLIERFFFPYAQYNQWIKSQFDMEYANDHCAILGINSVTPFKPMGGYVTEKQLSLVKSYFHAHPQKIKILVMHHNLMYSKRHKIINHADKILNAFASSNINIVLSGHIHYAHIEPSFLTNSLYIITAGTPISTRTLVPNSYNIIEFADKKFKWVVRSWQKDRFAIMSEKLYEL